MTRITQCDLPCANLDHAQHWASYSEHPLACAVAVILWGRKKGKFQERCLKPLRHAWRLRLTAIGTRASHIGKVETICQPSSLIGDRHRRCALGPLRARVQWSIHLPVQTAHFRHNLNTVEFDSRRYGMGDDAGSGKLDIEAVCAGASLRTALHFSRQLRQ
jgi:hypothetical protein